LGAALRVLYGVARAQAAREALRPGGAFPFGSGQNLYNLRRDRAMSTPPDRKPDDVSPKEIGDAPSVAPDVSAAREVGLTPG